MFFRFLKQHTSRLAKPNEMIFKYLRQQESDVQKSCLLRRNTSTKLNDMSLWKKRPCCRFIRFSLPRIRIKSTIRKSSIKMDSNWTPVALKWKSMVAYFAFFPASFYDIRLRPLLCVRKTILTSIYGLFRSF